VAVNGDLRPANTVVLVIDMQIMSFVREATIEPAIDCPL
jgi:hypothetical protein